MLLTIYSREYCHLCHDMIAALEALQPRYGFQLEIVDIDEDEALEARYGERVPVLTANGEALCHCHFEPAVLDAFFAEIR
jgi:thioredoxin reductase (NADPH)